MLKNDYPILMYAYTRQGRVSPEYSPQSYLNSFTSSPHIGIVNDEIK